MEAEKMRHLFWFEKRPLPPFGGIDPSQQSMGVNKSNKSMRFIY